MEEIIFQPIDWSYTHEQDDDCSNIFVIRLFGRTKQNKTIYVKVVNYLPYFYVEIPIEWDEYKGRILYNYLKKNVYPKEFASNLIKCEIVKRYKFYGFTNNTLFKFAKLTFNNYEAMRAFSYIFKKKLNIQTPFIKLKRFESNIEPILRCMHLRNLDAFGWISISKYKLLEYNETKCDIEISTDWTNLNKYDDNLIAPFVIAAFDIECTSFDGTFPQPERKEDEIIQIGTTYSRYGEDDCFRKVIITSGTCDLLDDIEVIPCKDEKEVLLKWLELIRNSNPDIITGYYIFGFDNEYMMKRSQLLEISERFSRLSRINNEICDFVSQKLESSALGRNKLNYYAMIGRVQFDLMKVIQRDNKLDSYKLDNVASQFIRGDIKKIEIKEDKTIITTANTYGLIKSSYIIIYLGDDVSENKYEEGKKFQIIDLTKNLIIVNGIIDIKEKYKKIYWCQVKDDIKARDIFRLHKGTSADRALIAKYCVQDCALCNKLIAKLQIITNNVGMANVCNVPLSYLFLRGQGVKIFSLVARKCNELNYTIPYIHKKFKEDDKKWKKDEDDSEEENNDDTFEGALVFPPEPGIYFDPVVVLDYSSLYPRSMIERNLSHETIVLEPKYDNLENVIYHIAKFNVETNGVVSEKICKFAQIENKKGIIPQILWDLLMARTTTKNLMEKENEPFRKKILDGLQLAYKVTANSLYGQTGASTSPICLKEIAASTTAIGRERLEFSKQFIEKIYNNLVNLALTSKEEYNKYSLEIYKNVPITKFFNPKKGWNTKEEYMEIFYSKINELLKGKKIEPKVIYGDSVTDDTPILIKKNNMIKIIRIDEIGNNYEPYYVMECNGTKKMADSKIIDTFVWTSSGWRKIKRIIRHETMKTICRIITITGIVDVTTDHSLIDIYGNLLKPDNSLDKFLLINDFINDETIYDDENDVLNGTMEKKQIYINEVFKDLDFITTTDKCFCAKIYYLLNMMNIGACIDFEEEIYKITKFSNVSAKTINNSRVTKIIKLPRKKRIVFDIETYDGSFCCGIGKLIVKNTDSVFFRPNITTLDTNELQKDKNSLETSIQLGIIASHVICILLPEPQEQAYEKTLWPFLIVTKKKYVGNLYEKDTNKFYQKSMGIVLKRRDNAPIVKMVCAGIINELLNNKSIVQAIQYTKDMLSKIFTKKIPIDKFIITKTLRDKYANRNSIAHAVLADRMTERDPGNKPLPNDRIPYAYIQVKEKKGMLQGERIEHPDYILERNLKIDYLFYVTNQIMKPAIQFLELIVDDPEKIFNDVVNKEIMKKNHMVPITNFFKKI
jgi:DNA polymerase elongation subunit (family B)